jgi:IS605 OrfB family transposase
LTRTYIGVAKQVPNLESSLLNTLMRKFQSGKRYSRERIHEGKNRKETEALTKGLFIPNSRYMRDAFLEAEASISSQRELLPIYVEQYEQNIKRTKMQIERLQNKRHHKEGIKHSIRYKESKIKKWEKQRDFYQQHINQGTIPKIVDGGKSLLRKLNDSKITKEQWRDARTNALYSRGEKSKGGNENIKLTHLEENLFQIAILNPLSDKRNDRIQFHVCFPEKFVFLLAFYLAIGEAYSIRVIRKKGRYEVHVTLEEPITIKRNHEYGVAGIDINPDNLSVTITYPNGNFRASKVFWMHEVNTISANKREWIIQQRCYEVMKWIQSFGINTLVMEELGFLQTNKSKSFNRMASNFSFSTMTKSLLSIAHKEEIAVIQVKAYYSSFIGKIKYQQTYGLSIHQAAAMVLARRGLGFKENIPKEWIQALFAKEAKQERHLTDLFKHWKLIKKWFDTTLEELRSSGLKIKGMYPKEILSYYTVEVPF